MLGEQDVETQEGVAYKKYDVVYMPEHPDAWQNGCVPFHRFVFEHHLGRFLLPWEGVQHINGDSLDNRIENLKIVGEHARDRACEECGKTYTPDKSWSKFCSPTCAAFRRRKVERPSKAELQKLVWEIPSVRIAERLGVSDRLIKKWCDAEGISKPPRGYWARKSAQDVSF